MKKINKKKIFIFLSIILISFTFCTTFLGEVRAELNPNADSTDQDVATEFNKIVTFAQTITSNSAFSGLSKLIGILAIVLYLGLAIIFTGGTGSIFPAPDSIIFNRVAIFDVNFVHPNDASLFGKMSGDSGAGNVVLQIYNSFTAIALTLFALAAMVVGIKLVLSSLASEKAAAKNALKNWLIGIVLLFLMRLIITGFFELNEILVYNLSVASDSITFSFNSLTAATGLLGGPISQAIAGALKFVGVGDVNINGFTGLLAKYSVQAVTNSDLISAIMLFVLLGQTITLIMAYAKRLVYVIILGVCAPLVIVLDTINKVVKGSSNILNSWFKEFATSVFMQTFHSILLVVIMSILSVVNANTQNTNPFFAGIAAIVLISGLIKFEKVYKKIFGLNDGMVGGLQGQATKLLVGLDAAKRGAQAVADNAGKYKNASKARTEARTKKTELVERRNETTRQRGEQYFKDASDNLNLALSLENDPIKQRELAARGAEYIQKSKEDGYTITDEQQKYFEAIVNAINNPVNFGHQGTQQPYYQRPDVAQNPNGFGERESYREPLSGYERDLSRDGRRFDYDSEQARMEYLREQTETGNRRNIVPPDRIGYARDQVERGNGRDTTPPSSMGRASREQGSMPNNNDAVIKTSKELQKELSKLRKEISLNNRSGSGIAAKTKEISKIEKEIKKTDAEIAKANKDMISAGVATVMGPANLAAGLGMGLGFGDSVTDALKGGYVTAGLDAIAEKTGSAVGTVINQRFDRNAKTDDTY